MLDLRLENWHDAATDQGMPAGLEDEEAGMGSTLEPSERTQHCSALIVVKWY